jgi:hypothetical protein
MKDITISLDDGTYEIVREAARHHRRTVESFVEYATRCVIANSQVNDEEMADIHHDIDLVLALDQARAEYRARRYRKVS